MTRTVYRGRFAPSPTGPVHLGTLIAAVASFLQARRHQGEWLLRIEDVDITRNVAGAADGMLHTLDRFGFEWDGEVVYQSQRNEAYEAALSTLKDYDLVYPCTCSRKQLAEALPPGAATVYPGTCRQRTLPLQEQHALRVKTVDRVIGFDDAVMGRFQQRLACDCGDFIIKRRDGLFAYQLAVVVDDGLQAITEVVRGVDLLDSTPRQIYLQQQLGYPQPGYLHLPLALDEHGNKLGKSAGAAQIDIRKPAVSLVAALDHLGQQAPANLARADVITVWQWAVENWNVARIPQHNRRVY